tara:strand:+ start:2059 stop:2805 length:747 start_codon:yes stop_codon:yes gene_type:complete
MKFSIITVTYNSDSTLRKTLESVSQQTWPNIEHIIIDGGSEDKTLELVNLFPHVSKCISERDSGIYDAMNKGLKEATGDVVGFLNSDDWFFSNSIIEEYANIFNSNNVDAVYGDLCFVKNDINTNIVRKWVSSSYKEGFFKKGWVPPHPTFYCKNNIYKQYGNFNQNLLFAADFDIMCRFFNKVDFKSIYSPGLKVNMRLGGATTKSIKNIISGNIEIFDSLKENNLKPGIDFIAWKLINRISQLINR